MDLHRPYIRKQVRQEVENRALKDENGKFLDENEKIPRDYSVGLIL